MLPTTGDRVALPRAAIEALVTGHPDRLVVVDEAYVDFGAESAVPLVARHDNLLVIQTLSKSRALAGLRVGFAIGQRPLIEALERVKDSFNSYPLDCFAIAGAVAAIGDDIWFEETRQRIMRSREALVRGLTELGFLVRHFQKPRIEDFLRITVGTDDECGRLIGLLRQTV